ncbi:MAG: MBOAT family protein, partial [Leptospiraceae bacterium]|nr:MBOAT family protein [Leptospiraceae bacterium]
MVFNSSSFVYFFAIVYVVYWALARYRSGQRWQNRFLLVASYFFYGWWDWIFLGLIFLSTITDYLVALGIQNAPQANRRRRGVLLFISVAVNIGLLAAFKYYDFFVTSFVGMVRMFQPDAFGDGSEWLLLNVLLPVGISFYTFQTLSYTIDVYRGIIPAERNFWDFSLYVSFFPQLVAGPIERAGDLLPQLKARREFNWSDVEAGLWFVLLGFFLKTYVADSLAPLVDQVYLSGKGVYGQMPALAANHGGAQVLIASVAFAFQIYGDFAGYSTIAMGAARLMGIRLTLNFDTPEFSQNPAELWRRWHST